MKTLGVVMFALSYPIMLTGAVGICWCLKGYFLEGKRIWLLFVYLTLILLGFVIHFWGAKIGHIKIATKVDNLERFSLVVQGFIFLNDT